MSENSSAAWWLVRTDRGYWGGGQTLEKAKVSARRHGASFARGVEWDAIGLSARPDKVGVDAFGYQWEGLDDQGGSIVVVEKVGFE